jgi:hypothetical protein
MPEPRESPQARWKCACPSWTTRRQCFQARYGFNNEYDEECECACHETDEDDDDLP